MRAPVSPRPRRIITAFKVLRDEGGLSRSRSHLPRFGSVVQRAACYGAASGEVFDRAIKTTKVTPVEVVTDQAVTYPGCSTSCPAGWHRTERLHSNNRVEADHGARRRHGLYAPVGQRLLPYVHLWHNTNIGAPRKRSLIAYGH
jgi:hypothetical protein